MSNTWKYTDKIEEMSDEAIRERMEGAMAHEIAEKIRTIPYVAEIEEAVEYRCPELSAKCPMTGLRDFYTLTVRFKPGQKLPELKSLRRYLSGYDDLPISHEHLAAKIYQEFKTVVEPTELYLRLDVSVRGGITTTVELGQGA